MTVNSRIHKLTFFGSGGPTSAMLIVTLRNGGKMNLELMLPNWSEACGQKGATLLLACANQLLAAYMSQRPVIIDYEIPPPPTSLPWITRIEFGGVVNAIPAPTAENAKLCPLP